MNQPVILSIAVLGGTGKEGPGLAMRWARAGYKVIIGSRQQSKAERVARELNEKLGLETIEGMENSAAAALAEISVLTVPYAAHQVTLESLKESLRGKVLVDTTARVDFRDPRPPPPPSAARMAQDLLGRDVRVVAAFQNVPAAALRRDPARPLGMDTLVCSDDRDTAEEVIKLAESCGLTAYYAGDLDNAIVLEGLTALLISLNHAYGAKTGAIRVAGIQK
jgi:hypothetical protein